MSHNELHTDRTAQCPTGHEAVRDGQWRIRNLPMACHAAAVLSDGTIWTVFRDTLYESRDGGETLAERWTPSEALKPWMAPRLYADQSDTLFFSSRSTSALFRKALTDTTFEKVLQLPPQGTMRGFAQCTTTGRRFLGGYSRSGPAVLFASDDGVSWHEAATWEARHIHDVRRDPATGWIYVVMGEGHGPPDPGSHHVYRSTDNGETFEIVVAGQGRRPLFTALNFLKGQVLLGTDHWAGGNYLASFFDTGEGEAGPLDICHRFEPRIAQMKVAPFCYFMEVMGDTLFAGFRGTEISVLLASTDGRDWRVVSLSTEHTGSSVNYICASHENGTGRIIVSGVPGLLIERVSPGRA